MGELNITINGVQQRDYIRQKTLRIESSGSSVAATCQFTVAEPLGSAQTLDIQEKDEILIWDGATRLFGGVVGFVKDRHDGPYRIFDVRGSDFTIRLEEEFIDNAFFEADTPDDTIIAAIFADWLPEIDAIINVDNLRNDMPQMQFEGISLREAMQQICRKTGGMFYVDFYRNLHYFSADEGVNAAFSLSTEPDMAASFPYEKFSRKRDATKLINRVLVVGNGISVWVDEAASQAYYGQAYKGRVSDPNILTIQEAEEYGAWYVGRYGWRHGEPDLQTRQLTMAGLRAGMRILLFNSVIGINQYYSIRKLQVTMTGGYSPDPQYLIRMKLGYRDAPGRVDVEPTPPTPVTPPSPPPYAPPEGGWTQEVWLGTKELGVFWTEDFVITPGEISGVPTWSAENTGLSWATEDLLDFTADPFAPGGRQYALMEDGVYRKVAGAAWTQQLTHAQARALVGGAGGGEFAVEGISCNINYQGYLACIYNATSIGAGWLAALLVSEDYGDSWEYRGALDGPTALGAWAVSLQVGAYQGSSPYQAGTVLYAVGRAGAMQRLFYSWDGGYNWSRTTLFVSPVLSDLLVDPNDQSRVFVGRMGTAGVSPVGVSTDHGVTVVNYDVNASVPLGAGNPYHLLSVAMDSRRTVRVGAGNVGVDGVNRTLDDGATWEEPTAQWSDDDLGVSLIQDSPDFLYLMRQQQGGDAGTNWQTIWASEDEGRTMIPKSGANANIIDTGGGDSVPYNNGGIRGIVEVWTSVDRAPNPSSPYVPGTPVDHELGRHPGQITLAQLVAHDLLSAQHGDTLAAAVSRGSLVVGDSTPDWSELPIGAVDEVLVSDGTDAAWAPLPGAFFKSYNVTTQGLGANPDIYAAGYYEFSAIDANLTQATITVTFGTANISYAAHAFLVAGGPGSASGGAGAVTIVVSGTSIDDLGTRTPGDSETIVADITAMALNDYFETTKKWLGQITYTLTVGATGHTLYAADFNYGLCKYDDFGNRDFTITDIEAVGFAGANDNDLDIKLMHHRTTGWIYSAAAFTPMTAANTIASLVTDHATDDQLASSQHFAWKRDNLSRAVTGSGAEGFLIFLSSSANNAIEYCNLHIGVSL